VQHTRALTQKRGSKTAAVMLPPSSLPRNDDGGDDDDDARMPLWLALILTHGDVQ
jgi:hypothetical protein